jgi:hypothetical protein
MIRACCVAGRQGIGDGNVLRFLTMAALGFLTSGCMIAAVLSPLVPVRGGGTTGPGGTTANATTPPVAGSGNVGTPQQPGNAVNQPPTPVATVAPVATAPATIQDRLIGTWLAQDTTQGLDRVTFAKGQPGSATANPMGGVVEALFNGSRITGVWLIEGNQIGLQFVGEAPFAFAFEFLGDGRLRIGQAIYRRG